MDKAQINCELLFISDGSKDRTYNNIIKAAALDARIHGIEFSRNFGKEAAIMAGLDAMEGECCVRSWIVIYNIHLKQLLKCIAYGNKDMKLSRA